METEAFWRGEFGSAYTDRNQVDPESRLEFWRSAMEFCTPATVLEVGCNRGHNLKAIQMVDTSIDVAGVDINDKAVNEARSSGVDAQVCPASEITSRFGHASKDLVFTAGVLIHVAPQDLNRVMQNIVETSARYVLAVEYEAADEEEVEYRGFKGKLWRRDYGALYQAMGLKLLVIVPNAEGFDNCTAWIMEKPGVAVAPRGELF